MNNQTAPSADLPTLLLITSLPHSRKSLDAIQFAKQKLQQNKPVRVFFYADGAYVANDLIWQTANVTNIADEWAKLAHNHQLALPVCVSTALARGISDDENAKRHQLSSSNLKSPFKLVGLSELALLLDQCDQCVQF